MKTLACGHAFILCLLISTIAYTSEWLEVEMNSIPIQKTIEQSIKPACGDSECDYEVYYFVGKPFDENLRTILFVSGGPGQIVDRTWRDLQLLEPHFNVVYFDVRGSGLSVPLPERPVSNSSDKFLRAEYIIRDMEEIRKKLLRDEPWDAIFGHSAGAMLSQRYAKRYGKVESETSISGVKRLILSAPVSRHEDNEPYRVSMLSSNLKNILKNNTKPECPWKRSPEDSSSARIEEIESATAKLMSEHFLQLLQGSNLFRDSTNDFCFLDRHRIHNIKEVFRKKLEFAVGYGSISFVIENHEKLAFDDPVFRNEFPYTREFFVAIRRLEMLGSPRQQSSELSHEIRSAQVEAAFIIGYYLSLEAKNATGPKKCDPEAPFLETLVPKIAAAYCWRFADAMTILSAQQVRRSARTAAVLGITSGVHRWPLRLLNVPAEDRCITGRQLIELVSEPTSPLNARNKTAKDLLGKIGFEPDDKVCVWDPENYKHQVPALVLRGTADPVTNGCQAEYFFTNGLRSDHSAFIEIPDAGHAWLTAINSAREAYLRTLVNKFIELPPGKFSQDTEVNQLIDRLGASNHTSTATDCRK